eukprot:scaffold19805_cov69-Phaeocystis_antarctica.AAC.1
MNPEYVLAALDGSATCLFSPGPQPFFRNAKPDFSRATGSRRDMMKHFGFPSVLRGADIKAAIRTWCR